MIRVIEFERSIWEYKICLMMQQRRVGKQLRAMKANKMNDITLFLFSLFTFSTDDRVVGAGDSLGRVKLRFLTTSDEQDAKLEEDFIAQIFHPVIVRTLGQE